MVIFTEPIRMNLLRRTENQKTNTIKTGTEISCNIYHRFETSLLDV
jgi:hypothetical protein